MPYASAPKCVYVHVCRPGPCAELNALSETRLSRWLAVRRSGSELQSSLQPRVLDVGKVTVESGQFVEWNHPSVVVVELVQMLAASVGRQ